MPRPFLFLLFATGGSAREIPPARTRASGSYRRERNSPPPGANCLGCNPRELSCAAMRHVCLGDNHRRARAPAVRTGVSADHRPQARIAWGATPANCPALPCGMFAWEITPAAHVRQRFVQACAQLTAPRRELPGVQPPRIDSGGTPPRQKVLCQAFTKESGWNKEGEMGSDYGYRNA